MEDAQTKKNAFGPQFLARLERAKEESNRLLNEQLDGLDDEISLIKVALARGNFSVPQDNKILAALFRCDRKALPAAQLLKDKGLAVHQGSSTKAEDVDLEDVAPFHIGSSGDKMSGRTKAASRKAKKAPNSKGECIKYIIISPNESC